jgi:hypothetical protein
MEQIPSTLSMPSTPFWLNEPTILFNKKYIGSVWPSENMSSVEKLNAISRFVIVASLLGYLITLNLKIILIAIVTLAVIAILFNVQRNQQAKDASDSKDSSKAGNAGKAGNTDNAGNSKDTKTNTKKITEGFANAMLYNELQSEYTNPQENNPMMNVLLPEISYDPNRNEAAPAYNPEVEKDLNNKTKDYIVNTTFGDGTEKQQEYIRRKLFSDIGDNYGYDFSMRNFYTNPNTTIPNDQGGFANFCFGDMISAKEGNSQALGRWFPRIGGVYN